MLCYDRKLCYDVILCYAELGNSTTAIFGGLVRRIKIPVIPQSLPMLNSDKRKISIEALNFFSNH